jgi:hypothetical protein
MDNNAMERPDPLAARDLLVGEHKSSDVVREAIAAELRAGRSPAALLGEIPSLSEHQVREAMAVAAMLPPPEPRKIVTRRGPKRGHMLGISA